MSERPERVWYFYLDDMIGCSEKVLAYCAGLDQLAFSDNSLVYDATVRNLEIIGEAAPAYPKKYARQISKCRGACWSPLAIA